MEKRDWFWKGLIPIAATVSGVFLGVYFSAYTASVKVETTLQKLEEGRIPFLAETISWQLDVMRERLWRLENIALSSDKRLPYKKLPDYEELMASRETYWQTSAKLLREFIEVYDKKLQCDPYPGAVEK